MSAILAAKLWSFSMSRAQFDVKVENANFCGCTDFREILNVLQHNKGDLWPVNPHYDVLVSTSLPINHTFQIDKGLNHEFNLDKMHMILSSMSIRFNTKL